MVLRLAGEETVALPAHLGLRLRDDRTGALVTDGLAVRVVRRGAARPVTALRTVGGMWAVPTLPGLPRFGPASMDAGDILGAVPQRDYDITVDDPLGRFHAVRVGATLPDAAGFLDDPCPGAGMPGVLAGAFSLPSVAARPPEPGLAVVHVAVTDGGPARPVPFCVVEASIDGAVMGRAVAGADGQATVQFPLPEPDDGAADPPAWDAVVWDVEVRVRHAPPPAAPAPDPRLLTGPDGRARLDLCRVMRQPPVAGGAAVATVRLRAGRPAAVAAELP